VDNAVIPQFLLKKYTNLFRPKTNTPSDVIDYRREGRRDIELHILSSLEPQKNLNPALSKQQKPLNRTRRFEMVYPDDKPDINFC
jgi:hypothetical protein